jgi:MATE family multidrug resistance protein
VVVQLASITFMVHMGLSNAATIRAGNAWGFKDRDRLARGAQVATAMSLAFAAVTIILFLTIPKLLISLWLDPTDPDFTAVLTLGVGLLAMGALFQLMDGAQVIALGVLRGVQDTKVPMVMAAVSYWVIGIPCSYVFGFVLGWEGVGVWLGLSVGLACAAAALMWRFWHDAVPRVGEKG